MLPLILGQIAGTVGKAGMGFADAASMYTESDADRLRKLQRLQELGQLGLSDEELNLLREQALGPLQAALREQDIRAAARTQVQDIGSGQEALRQMAEDDRVARQMVQGGQIIAREHGAARKAQEAELRALARARDQQGAAYAKAALGALAGAGEVVPGVADILGTARADREEREAIYGSLGEDMPEDEAAMLEALLGGYGG